jgi:nucleoside-diphosphate-sugar epimerase
VVRRVYLKRQPELIPSIILGNGFVAAQVIIAALNRDHQVIATVRAEEKAKQTRGALEKKVGSKISNLSFAIVPVVEADGAFDDILKAQEFVAVIHTATPFYLQALARLFSLATPSYTNWRLVQ